MAEALLRHFTKQPSAISHQLSAKNVSVNSDSAGREKLTLKTDAETKRWGAIKYTKTAIYSSIIDTPEIIAQKDKDTARLLAAGAEEVLWVQSPYSEIKDVLPVAIERLSYLDGIIVEGNSAIEFLKPDIVIFIFGRDSGNPKESARKILDMADIILFDRFLPEGLPEKVKKIRVSETDEFMNSIYGLLAGR